MIPARIELSFLLIGVIECNWGGRNRKIYKRLSTAVLKSMYITILSDYRIALTSRWRPSIASSSSSSRLRSTTVLLGPSSLREIMATNRPHVVTQPRPTADVGGLVVEFCNCNNVGGLVT
jgi:hypothetical protein